MSKIAKPESSNPILQKARAYASPTSRYGGIFAGGTRATMAGVVNKTAILLAIAMVAGALAYAIVPAGFSAVFWGCLASGVVGLGIAWTLAKNPSASETLAPLYALVEGAFLGVFTKALDGVLVDMGVQAPMEGASLALPALVISFSCTLAMLLLYRIGLLRPSQTFKSVVSTLTLGVLLAYLANLVLELCFGMHLPYLSIRSAFEGGTSGLIGIGLNFLILILASLWLVIDLEQVEEIVNSESPVELEWYGAFGLLVTLAWIYYEAVKLAFRVALARE